MSCIAIWTCSWYVIKSTITPFRIWSRDQDPKLGVIQISLPECLKNLHDRSEHQGIERTFDLIRQRCYWPKMFTVSVKNSTVHCMISSPKKKENMTERCFHIKWHLIINRILAILSDVWTIAESTHWRIKRGRAPPPPPPNFKKKKF